MTALIVKVTPARRAGAAEMLLDLPNVACKVLIEQHLTDLEVKTLRLVCKSWKVFIDSTITALKPRDFTESQVRYRATVMLDSFRQFSSAHHDDECLGATLDSGRCAPL